MISLDVVGTVLGLLYLYLEMRENAWMWVVGAIMPLIYTVLLYQKGLYADCGMEVYYFLAGVYGLIYWLRHSERRQTGRVVRITRTPLRLVFPLVSVTLVLWGLLAWLLITYTDSRVPYIDALTTALSIVAMWMLSRKFTHQWLVWLVVDAISVGLYVYKDLYGRALLYTIYTVLALYGYWKWEKKLRTAA